MKAALISGYGSPDVVVTVGEAPKPAPQAGEVLVRVRAATVNRTDTGELEPGLLRIFYGLSRPRRTIFGMDFAGVVEALGAGVTAFKPGDRVFGMAPSRKNGAQADYVCVPEDAAIALIPEALRFDQAVVCEGAFYANSGLKLFVKPGDKVLIYGGSGAIGSAAVQLAKAYGAEVTAVAATHQLDIVKALGADRVCDYTAGDFTKPLAGERFDYVFDAVGKTNFFRCRKLLKPTGVYAATDVGQYWSNLPLMLWSMLFKPTRVVVPLPARGSAHAFVAFMAARMEGDEFRALIDRHYPLDAIADAYRYVMTGKKTGIVVIDMVG